MWRFWRNPEFVRHLRSELRPARAITLALVVLFVCAMIGLACWSQRQQVLANAEYNAQRYGGLWVEQAERIRQDNPRQMWLQICQWLFGSQCVLLAFWSTFMCAQSIWRERDRKTWDFQRTTSLTPAELAVGKLFGEPVLAYFAVLCVLPITLWATLAAKLSVWNFLSGYISVLAASLFLGLCGLWLSILLESRSGGVGMIGALGLYGVVLATYGFADSWFPGLAAFSPLSGLHKILGIDFDGHPGARSMLFGHCIPWSVMSLLLYGSFGAWITVMLLRNLKRDFSEIRLLSRWQAVGCAAFLNFVFYALFRPGTTLLKADTLATFMVGVNGFILFAIGLASLTPLERLKVWWRGRIEGVGGIFSEDGLPWPWLVLSAVVAYALMVWGLLAWRYGLDFHPGVLRTAALQLLGITVFVTRDILFVQWCTLTRFRQPVLKAFLFLCLYYGSALVIVGICSIWGDPAAANAMSLLTPAGMLDTRFEWGGFSSAIYVYGGLAMQAGVIGMILLAISHKLGRPTLVAAVSEG